jgi:hypothetical protein
MKPPQRRDGAVGKDTWTPTSPSHRVVPNDIHDVILMLHICGGVGRISAHLPYEKRGEREGRVAV